MRKVKTEAGNSKGIYEISKERNPTVPPLKLGGRNEIKSFIKTRETPVPDAKSRFKGKREYSKGVSSVTVYKTEKEKAKYNPFQTGKKSPLRWNFLL